MGHVDPSHLMELALGHTGGEDDDGALRHVASCSRCRGELLRMTRVVTAARGAQVPDLPVSPPERVWQRIAREAFRTDDGLPRPRKHSPHSYVGRPAGSVRRRRATGTGRRAGLLALAAAVAVLLRRWLRTSTGRDLA
ncbi:hypothetical protein EV562_101698 [Streptomyces sp. BK208]|uniref:hypothetical protein n=1 Tax=Streptomyces sp. BK208 TaxID=2512150 RepID=UPI00105B4E8E|nr:hypothetical protein [Streptomyces sp. BK208]TDT42728.1 hypothetical protein EV562_101698 [Streptomyces sp. BK208]